VTVLAVLPPEPDTPIPDVAPMVTLVFVELAVNAGCVALLIVIVTLELAAK
jgi:hypothetical protein